ncbi:hypothetical protein H0E87_014894 [Populus deltoides]|uniref:Uncharacterized protein n=1 Tax=Populus deltoides TaxID=3696 RepID=A0A8T2YF72_POPDE|nr:hypothetical protein H0E87_014894 [Populus deltoides]
MKSWTDRREEDMVLSELGTITGLQIGIVRGGGKSQRSRGPRDLRVKALVFTSQNLLDPCSPMVKTFHFHFLSWYRSRRLPFEGMRMQPQQCVGLLALMFCLM